LEVGRCYSGRNVRGFGTIYVDWHFAKAYTYYAKNRLLFTPYFPETLLLERLEMIITFMQVADGSKQNEYQGASKLQHSSSHLAPK
jgi:hypothetical protein